MNGSEVLRIVDAIHRDKAIDKEIVFDGIEQAILSAARKHYGEDEQIEIQINRQTGEPTLLVQGAPVDSDMLGQLLGRISAQTAKQVMIQRIREAERDTLFDDFIAMRGQIVSGIVGRFEGHTATVNLGKIEGILPKSEQIPGESYRTGDRVRAVVLEVRKAGSRLKVVLSRTHADLVRRLFELEIPEIGERVIEIRSLAREAGYRSKVAVSCSDQKIDCVGACVGVRGARIKNVVDELAGERIDIVRWNDSLQVLVPNALQPAEVEDVILCQMLGRVIVLVAEDQLSLAIGRRGQNVRLASKLVGWDIEIMTHDELGESLERAERWFSQLPNITPEQVQVMIEEGFLSYNELTFIDAAELMEFTGMTEEQADEVLSYAEEYADDMERSVEQERAEAEAAARATAAAEAEAAAASTETAATANAEGESETQAPAPAESGGESAAGSAEPGAGTDDTTAGVAE